MKTDYCLQAHWQMGGWVVAGIEFDSVYGTSRFHSRIWNKASISLIDVPSYAGAVAIHNAVRQDGLILDHED